jgi:hypothetical protein
MSHFRSFGGEFRKEQRVSLAGRSRTEETRAQVLERTRQERERRRQEKLEQRSANSIQASTVLMGMKQLVPKDLCGHVLGLKPPAGSMEGLASPAAAQGRRAARLGG